MIICFQIIGVRWEYLNQYTMCKQMIIIEYEKLTEITWFCMNYWY